MNSIKRLKMENYNQKKMKLMKTTKYIIIDKN